MLFLHSVTAALFGVASMVAATNTVASEGPACMKSCLAKVHLGTPCSAGDVGCACTESPSLLAKVGACAATACRDDKDFGAGLRSVVKTCASAEAHRAVLKRYAPGLFKREDYDACQVCADSKSHPPVLLTPPTYPVSSNTSYTVTSNNGNKNNSRTPPPPPPPPVLSNRPTPLKQLPKSSTGAASTIKAATTLSVLGAVATLLVMA